MSDAGGVWNAQQRKKAARKRRQHTERQAHRNLDQATSEAIEIARRIAPEVAAAPYAKSDRAIDVELASASDAQFVRKRVNDALQIDEWLDDLQVWVWKPSDRRPALTEQGRSKGFELRIERTPT